jgi:hypothetical protein
MNTNSDNLRALREALAKGVYEVTIGSQTVKYKSSADLMTAIRYYEGLVANEKGYAGRTVQAVAGRRFL